MKTVKSRIMHSAMRLFAEKGSMTISVSELAKMAGVSRGTVYNNFENPGDLFNLVCDLLHLEMRGSFGAGPSDPDDPAVWFAMLLQQMIRRVHEEPDWGHFAAHFAMVDPRLRTFWCNAPADMLHRGLICGRFAFASDQLSSITTLGGGMVMGAMSQVLQGDSTWRRSSADTAEFFLRAIGIARAEARAIAALDFAPPPRVDFAALEHCAPMGRDAARAIA